MKECENMERLPIAFIADRNFFMPTIVAVTSLLENKYPESIYVIYIVCVGFSAEQISIIKKIEKKYQTQIIIVEIQEEYLQQKYEALGTHDCNATKSALIKFDLPDICKKEEKLLYLDGDIIVKDDLMSILSIGLNDDVYVAAVKDSGAMYSERLIRQGNVQYFNSGVMYLNLNAMRRDGISKKLVDAKMNSTDNTLMDQNILNSVMANNVKIIDYKYNTLYVNLRRAHYFHKLELNTINSFCGKNYSSWNDILQQASIVHYSSFDKPWKYSDVNGGELWDYYYNKSLVSNMQLKRKKLYTRQIEMIISTKVLRLLGILIWEIHTKGLKITIHEIMALKKS